VAGKIEMTEHTRWNFAVFVTESTFFMAGMAWVDPYAVLPLFIGRLTPSTVVVGVITVVQQLGWKLPQIFMAAVLGHRPHKLPFLRWPVLFGRAPFLIFILYLWTKGVEDANTVIWFLVIAYSCVALGNGVLGISWHDIIAKSVPSQLRGRFFGTMQFATAVSAFAIGFVVRWMLGENGPGFPRDYMILFTAMTLFLTLSTIGCWLIREPIRPVLDRPQSVKQVFLSTGPMLRDRSFRTLAVASLLGFAVAFSAPFYVVFAKEILGVRESLAGVYIWAMTIGGALASILWGYLNDNSGPRSVMRGAGILVTLTPLLAVALPPLMLLSQSTASLLPYAFALVFLAAGSAIGALWMGGTNYLFELCSDEDRPRYIAIYHLCTLPAALNALLVGWLLNSLAFQIVFLMLATAGAMALVTTLGMPPITIPSTDQSMES